MSLGVREDQVSAVSDIQRTDARKRRSEQPPPPRSRMRRKRVDDSVEVGRPIVYVDDVAVGESDIAVNRPATEQVHYRRIRSVADVDRRAAPPVSPPSVETRAMRSPELLIVRTVLPSPMIPSALPRMPIALTPPPVAEIAWHENRPAVGHSGRNPNPPVRLMPTADASLSALFPPPPSTFAATSSMPELSIVPSMTPASPKPVLAEAKMCSPTARAVLRRSPPLPRRPQGR